MIQQLILNGLISGSMYAFVALSFMLIYSVGRFFHFAHAAVCTTSAYACYALSSSVGASLWVSIPFAIIVAASLGVGLEALVYQPLRRQGASSLGLLLASLGIYMVVVNMIAVFFGNDTRTIRFGTVSPGVSVLGGRITSLQIATFLTCLLCYASTWAFLRFTKSGRSFRAVADDPELANIVGIHADNVSLAAFAGGSALAGLAAILFALDVDINPTIGMTLFLPAVAAMIVGGANSVLGVLLGGMLLGLAQHVALLWIGTEWQDSIAFLVLAGFLLLRPQGFLGRTAGTAKG